MSLTFDEATHTYTLNGSPVPSVTQILRAEFPNQWQASEWYLNRGTQVHAAAAFIARGVAFDHDPSISGQVAACIKWFADTQAVPMFIEERVFSLANRYAGTLDLIARIAGKLVIVDWKASINPVCQWQLGAYQAVAPVICKTGFAVQLNDDGTYQTGGPWDMAKAGREFANIRSVYGLKEREKLLPKKEDEG